MLWSHISHQEPRIANNRDHPVSTSDEIDDYLAACTKDCLNGLPIPAWPDALDTRDDDVLLQVSYHGIALLLIAGFHSQDGWPDQVKAALLEESKLQALWEESHARTIAALMEALHKAGVNARVMKGTALAYSIYTDPALRRRGDTDILIQSGIKADIRSVFKAQGFRPEGDRRALQEVWRKPTNAGFVHEVDLHWRPSASMAVSHSLSRSDWGAQNIALPKLSPNAQAIDHVSGFVQICINRAAHSAFGYYANGQETYANGRLIWAVDLHLIAAQLSDEDWSRLSKMASACGARDIVLSGIKFCQRRLGTSVPSYCLTKLQSPLAGTDSISSYFHSLSDPERRMCDLQNAPDLVTKAAILRQHIFPGREFMRQRYPASHRWPVAALHIRRLLDAMARFLLSRVK